VIPVVRWDHFAKLIAGRTDSLRVMDASSRYHAVPWPDTEPVQPYAVHLSTKRGAARVLALDLDASRGDVAADASMLRHLFSLIGVRFVETVSGPTNGAHFFVPFQEPLEFPAVRALAEVLSQRLETLDVSMLLNSSTGAIRPPRAPHRISGRSELVTDPDAALEILQTGNDRQIALDLIEMLGIDERVLRPSRAPLSPTLFRMLHTGEGLERYESMNEAVMALATSVVARGYDGSWLRAQLQEPRHFMTEALQEHVRRDGSKRNGRRLVEVAIKRAHSFVAANPTITSHSDAREVMSEIDRHANKRVWNGRRGLTIRAVLQAHIAIAQNCGSIQYNASQRQLAELSSLHTRKTVEAANRDLVALGYLSLVRHGTAKNASTWKLSIPHRTLPERSCEFVSGRLGHPLFAWRQLGKSTAQVFKALEDGATTTREIADLTQLHPGTVRRCLQRLARLETPLATLQEGRWRPTEPLSSEDPLDRAATETQALQQHVALVARHESERLQWRRYIELRLIGPAPPAAPFAA
jgi:hypothetical protein